jgi:hypothetical protein
VNQSSAFVRRFMDLMDEREADDVLPPLRTSVAVGHRQVDVGEAHDLRHGANTSPK